jgi:hypothetical protein
MPAMLAANSVIASAKRLIEVRQRWRSSSSTAEMKVPAWPMPIHQTKLAIAKPQATGMSMPQMPTPLTSSQLTAPSAPRAGEGAQEGAPPLPAEAAGQHDAGDLVGDVA